MTKIRFVKFLFQNDWSISRTSKPKSNQTFIQVLFSGLRCRMFHGCEILNIFRQISPISSVSPILVGGYHHTLTHVGCDLWATSGYFIRCDPRRLVETRFKELVRTSRLFALWFRFWEIRANWNVRFTEEASNNNWWCLQNYSNLSSLLSWKPRHFLLVCWKHENRACDSWRFVKCWKIGFNLAMYRSPRSVDTFQKLQCRSQGGKWEECGNRGRA